jgi:hypothetical protein
VQLARDRDLTKLVEYCEIVARALQWAIPLNYPLVGQDAFRTATGVHAAAIVKAMQRRGMRGWRIAFTAPCPRECSDGDRRSAASYAASWVASKTPRLRSP